MALSALPPTSPSPASPPLEPDLEAVVENVVAILLSCLLGVALACFACISLVQIRRKRMQATAAAQLQARPQTADDRLIARMVATGRAAAGMPVSEGVVLSEMSATVSSSTAVSMSRTPQPLHTAHTSQPSVVVGVPLNVGVDTSRT